MLNYSGTRKILAAVGLYCLWSVKKWGAKDVLKTQS